MSDSILKALPIIAEGTAVIESAFLSAGQGLSRGLAALKALTDGLAALGAELDGGSTAAASAQLSRMSRTLRLIAELMPADGKVLGDLLVGNQGLGRKFDDLIGDMRMMVIVSRSARLEAVVSHEQRVSLEEFSRTIDHQIGDVQRRIDVCAAEHGKLTALLEQSARAHLAFDANFRTRIVALASELDEALTLIGRRRTASLAFMQDAAAKARGIAQTTGMALVSLQIGDNTRQRLEHVSYALTHANALASGGTGDAVEAATMDLLCRLGEAQLRDTVATFDEEATRILDAFAALGRETESLVSSGRATYGRDAEIGGSFMEEFRARFAAARDIVGACEANRQAVEQAITALRAMLDALDGTLTTLGGTGEDLVIVAVNVGLKASRLGSKGRGLVTVASELKRLAGQITLHAEGLLATFGSLGREAAHFGRGAEGDMAESTSLDAEAAGTLHALALADARIAEVLGIVQRTGRDFDATVTDAARRFGDMAADIAGLGDAVDHLGGEVDPPGEDALASAAQAVDALLLPLYSMAQERDIHAAICGTGAPQPETAFEDRAA